METDPTGTNIIVQLLILAFLTLVNAFFAGAEMAIVSVNKNKINMLVEKRNKKAQLILKLLEEPTKFLSTIQVAITLSSFFASASAATGISESLAVALTSIHVPYAHQISFVGITILLSFFTLVFGELVPKRIALQKSEAMSMVAVKPIIFIATVASPFIKLLTLSTNIVLKIFGLKSENLEEEISKEEIKSLVEQGKEQGVFNKIEQDMINSIFEFDDKLAREIMTPRINVFAIDISEPLESYIDDLFRVTFSRIPLYDEEFDNIIGVLYIKDYYREARKVGYENVDIRSILHPAYLVPESKNIDELFREMQHQKKYFTILINEYGEVAGIVSIEDLVEEIMGDIEDEYDKKGPKILAVDEKTYVIDGLITVDEINSKLNLELESENFDTISGLLIDTLGFIPQETDKSTVNIDDVSFDIMSIKENRIEQLRLHLPDKEIEY